LGRNDAADPALADSLSGDTPGALGKNDASDPDNPLAAVAAKVLIIIKKSTRTLYLYKGGKLLFKTTVAHGRGGTTKGKRKIKKWVPGPVSRRLDYSPVTWFSFGATFSPKYKWPETGKSGDVYPAHGKFPAKRIRDDLAQVYFDGDWYNVWKDSNPFGALMADLEPGKIELHGTHRDEKGNDQLPSMVGDEVTHGCVRVSNKAIKKIKRLAPVGTDVRIVP
jgi:hypothetical protein